MFNTWFKIEGDKLYDEDYLHGTPWSNGGNLWGRKLGGKWCLDYYFKICFDLTKEYWESKCGNNLKTNKDLYNLFDDLGIAYKRNDDFKTRNLIHYKGKLYNEKFEEIINNYGN